MRSAMRLDRVRRRHGVQVQVGGNPAPGVDHAREGDADGRGPAGDDLQVLLGQRVLEAAVDGDPVGARRDGPLAGAGVGVDDVQGGSAVRVVTPVGIRRALGAAHQDPRGQRLAGPLLGHREADASGRRQGAPERRRGREPGGRRVPGRRQAHLEAALGQRQLGLLGEEARERRGAATSRGAAGELDAREARQALGSPHRARSGVRDARHRGLAERSGGVRHDEGAARGGDVEAHALGGLARGGALVEAGLGRVEASQEVPPGDAHRVRRPIAVTRQEVGGEGAAAGDEAVPLRPRGDVAPVDALAQGDHLRCGRRRRRGDRRLDAQAVALEGDERMEQERLLQHPPHHVEHAPALAGRLDGDDLHVRRGEAEEHRGVDGGELVPPTFRPEVDDPAVRRHHGDALAALQEPVPRPRFHAGARQRDAIERVDPGDGALAGHHRQDRDGLEGRHRQRRGRRIGRGQGRRHELRRAARRGDGGEHGERERDRRARAHARAWSAVHEGVDKPGEIDQLRAPHERGGPRASCPGSSVGRAGD